ncbi:MAG: PAS domain S-box protein [Methanoregula sp.]|jgi:PAS domain S-box-containing protein
MISLLYIDDEPGLLELGKLFLESAGGFEVSTAESGDAGLEQLAQHDFDAIVSDFQMPGMDGIELLKKVRKTFGTIPFILFTGRGREEVVIEAINNGVDFYLQKGGDPKAQFAELAHKVRQSVSRRKAEIALTDSEKRLADIINFLPDATFAIDTRGIVIAWNRAMERMTGVHAEDVLGKGDYEYALPFYHERRPLLINLVLENGPAVAEKYPLVKNEGKTLFSEITIPHFNEGRGAALWFTASPLYDRKGEVVGAIESIREITERKRAEEARNESENRFRELADLLPQGIYEADTDGRMIYANRLAQEMYGYTDEDIEKGLNVLNVIAPVDRKRAVNVFSKMVETGTREQGREEYLAVRKDGSLFPVSIYSSPIYRDGRISGVRGVVIDITDRKKNEDELRAANEQLVASEEELRAQYDELASGEKRIRMSESRLKYMLGFDEYTHKSEKDLLEYAIEGAGLVTGSTLGYLAFLNEDESELSMYAWSKNAMAECSMMTKPIVYKTEKTGLWGEAVRQRRPVITNDYAAPDPAKKGYPQGHPEIIRHMNVPVIDEGHVILVAGVANKSSDYTENDVNELLLLVQGLWNILKRRRAEETRKESEAKYQNIIDHAPSGMHFYELKPDGSLVFTGSNPGADRILGVVHHQFIGRTLEEAFPPLAETEVPAQYRRVAADGGTWQTEQVTYDGVAIHGAYAVTAFQTSPGAMVAMFMDITERKRAETDLKAAYEQVAATEKELREQYEKLAAAQAEISTHHQQLEEIASTVPGVVYQFYARPDGSMGIYYASNRTDEIFGLNSDLERFFPEFTACVHPDDRPGFLLSIEDAVKRRADWHFEGRFTRHTGETIWFEGISSPVVHANELVFTGVILDITERKKMMEAIRESEGRYRSLVELSPDAVVVHQGGKILYANPAALHLVGAKTEGDMIGREVLSFIHPDDRAMALEDFRQMYEEGKKIPLKEERLLRINGDPFTVEVIASSIQYKGNLSVLVVFRDITGRKRAGDALRENSRKYAELFELGSEAIFLIDNETGALLEANAAACEMYGYKRDLLLTMKNTDLSAEKEETRKVTTEAPPGVVRVPVRYHRRKDGTVFPVEIIGRFFVWDGRPVHIAAIRDITEQNQSEAAIREANRKLNLLNSITRHDIQNQLTVAQGYTQLAALSKPDPVVVDFLARITAAIETIQRQIEFTKAYQELGVHAPAWVRVIDVISSVRPGKIALRNTCKGFEIFADPMIDKVFFNLFDNALKYGERVTTVTVGCERRENSLVITFADNGCGVAPGEKQKIFEKGYGKNTGLGLFLVREILAITDITISETGTPGEGAVFEITVPEGAYRNAE